ncbi:MAG: hypothetical protein AMXMBFR56_37250 [Polyangiaceae bacterium]
MTRRTKLKLGGGLLGAALLAGALAFGPLVRAKASEQAARRGAALEIGAVRPGLGRVWLRDVAVRVPEVPALEVRLDSVEVRVTGALGVREVRAHGGSARVRGTLDEVREQVARWREKLPVSSGGGGATTYSADGLALDWEGLSEGRQLAWGVAYSRSGEREELSADLVRAMLAGISLEVRGGRAVLGRRDGRRVLERVSTEAVALVGDLGSSAPDRAAPVPSDGAAKAKPGEPADRWNSARLIDAERGPRLRAAFSRAAGLVAAALPEGSELDLGGLTARLVRAGETLNVGPARLRVVRTPDKVTASLLPAPDAEHALKLSLEVPLGEGPVGASVEGGPVSLAALGVQEGDFGLLDVNKASLEARASATLSADGKELGLSGNAKLAGLAAQKKWLAPTPVRGLGLAVRGRAAFWLDGTRLRIDSGEVEVGKVRVELKGEVEQSKDHKKIWLEGGVPLASCQSMLDATPEGLMPLLAGTRLTGTFALTGKLEVDTRALDKMLTKWSSVNECRITGAPAEIAPSRFSRSWTREVLDVTGRPVQVQSGPGTMGWVPKAAISKHMDTAVLICEDGAFFRHHGFDEEAIRNSIRENVKAGRFVRGASTISMQLAKNLYLSREKTLSRKLQEAVLTHLLEQELTKDQILELYLNVIEFGPGIYGIGPAAAHYFNSTPSQLSLGQSLYLASILPNPKRQYFGADGAVTPGWSEYLRKLMRIAVKIRRVSEAELEEALVEQVWFKKPSSPRIDGEHDSGGAELESPPLESEQQEY